MKKILLAIIILISISSCNLSEKLNGSEPFLIGKKHQLVPGNPRIRAQQQRKKEIKISQSLNNLKK